MCIDSSYSRLFLLMLSSNIPGSSAIFTPALTQNCRHALFPFHPLWLSWKWELLLSHCFSCIVNEPDFIQSSSIPSICTPPVILSSQTWVTGNLPRVVVSHNAVVICWSQTKQWIWIDWRRPVLGIQHALTRKCHFYPVPSKCHSFQRVPLVSAIYSTQFETHIIFCLPQNLFI